MLSYFEKSSQMKQDSDIESKMLSYFEKSCQMKQDSDYQFLMSLLSSLQEVPEERKLRVRMILMDVLLQEQEYRNSRKAKIVRSEKGCGQPRV
jgi:hypothetical protein